MSKKRCPTCGTEDLTAFGTNKSKPDGLQTHCKVCRKQYNSDYYNKTKDLHNPIRYARSVEAKQTNRENLAAYLKEHPCVDCGEADIIVLQFDHQSDKKYDISVMVLRGHRWESILKEIEKCEVVCANDHMRRTAKQFGWYKSTLLNSEAEYFALNEGVGMSEFPGGTIRNLCGCDPYNKKCPCVEEPRTACLCTEDDCTCRCVQMWF